MQITFNPFLLTADQATLLGDFLARAAGVLPLSDRPDVGATEVAPQMPLFTASAPAPVAVASVPAVPTSPSPAPVISAPPAVVPPAAPVALAPEKDKRNMPWDERIHSANKTMNADGTWRRRSKIGDDLVAQVEAELLGLPPAPPVPTAAELVVKMSAEPVSTPVAPAIPVSTPVAPAIPVPAPVAPAIPVPAALTFAALANRAGPAMTAGRIGEINAALAPLGTNFLGLATNPAMLALAEQALTEAGLLTSGG